MAVTLPESNHIIYLYFQNISTKITNRIVIHIIIFIDGYIILNFGLQNIIIILILLNLITSLQPNSYGPRLFHVSRTLFKN